MSSPRQMIETSIGRVDELLLEKRTGSTPEGEWVEYYLMGVLVHRSAVVQLRPQAALQQSADHKF